MAEPPGLAPLRAMLDQLPKESIEELELTLASSGAPTAAETAKASRERELGPLAEMLKEMAGASEDLAQALVKRQDYEARRPAGSTPSEALVARYGSWTNARRAAAGLMRWEGGGRPWPNALRGQRMPAMYTREEVLAAVRACGEAVGAPEGVPTANVYYQWVRKERAEARQRGAERPRLPYGSSVRRFFPGWAAVRAALRCAA